MDVGGFLAALRARPDFYGQLQHVEVLPARNSRYGSLQDPISHRLVRLLAAQGIETAVHPSSRSDRGNSTGSWTVLL